jgi:hypothetical protein
MEFCFKQVHDSSGDERRAHRYNTLRLWNALIRSVTLPRGRQRRSQSALRPLKQTCSVATVASSR